MKWVDVWGEEKVESGRMLEKKNPEILLNLVGIFFLLEKNITVSCPAQQGTSPAASCP